MPRSNSLDLGNLMSVKSESRKAVTSASTEMPRETEAPMIDIAVELGYFSSAHFSRAFRKTVGRLSGNIRRGAEGFQAAAHS